AASFSVATQIAAAAESGRLLTGKAAMGDWTADAPDVRRKIAVNDLPAPSSNVFAINRARVVDRPANAQPQVPPGFRIELYASGIYLRAADTVFSSWWCGLRRRSNYCL